MHFTKLATLLLPLAIFMPGMAWAATPSTSDLSKTIRDDPKFTFTPGPGLPTLEEMGLTPQSLMNDTYMAEWRASKGYPPLEPPPPPPAPWRINDTSPASFFERRQWQKRCSFQGSLGTAVGAEWCYRYILNLPPGTRCWTNSEIGEADWCKVTLNGFETIVSAVIYPPVTHASSLCVSFAASVWWCRRTCLDESCEMGTNCMFACQAVTEGNGDLFVYIQGQR